MKVVALSIWLVLYPLAAVALGPKRAEFPDHRPFRSPDGNYFISNTDKVSGDEAEHQLLLLNARTGSRVPLYTYNRSVEVFWCPSSRCVVINNFEGSNVSSVYLINITPEMNVVDLGQLLFNWMDDHNQREIASSCDHVYAYASRVARNGQITLVLTGYNGINPKGFRREFGYGADDRLLLIKTTDRFAGVN